MRLRILRRLRAAQDAEAIANHIAKDSLRTAVRFLEQAEATLVELAESPGGGNRFESLHPELADLRYRRIKEFPNHFVFFFARNDAIEVVRILHGARDLDAELRKH